MASLTKENDIKRARRDAKKAKLRIKKVTKKFAKQKKDSTLIKL